MGDTVGDPRRNVRRETVVPRSDAEGEVWWIRCKPGRRGKTKTDSLLPRFMIYIYIFYICMGVSSNGGTPKTPQNDHF